MQLKQIKKRIGGSDNRTTKKKAEKLGRGKLDNQTIGQGMSGDGLVFMIYTLQY